MCHNSRLNVLVGSDNAILINNNGWCFWLAPDFCSRGKHLRALVIEEKYGGKAELLEEAGQCRWGAFAGSSQRADVFYLLGDDNELRFTKISSLPEKIEMKTVLENVISCCIFENYIYTIVTEGRGFYDVEKQEIGKKRWVKVRKNIKLKNKSVLQLLVRGWQRQAKNAQIGRKTFLEDIFILVNEGNEVFHSFAPGHCRHFKNRIISMSLGEDRIFLYDRDGRVFSVAEGTSVGYKGYKYESTLRDYRCFAHIKGELWLPPNRSSIVQLSDRNRKLFPECCNIIFNDREAEIVYASETLQHHAFIMRPKNDNSAYVLFIFFADWMFRLKRYHYKKLLHHRYVSKILWYEKKGSKLATQGAWDEAQQGKNFFTDCLIITRH